MTDFQVECKARILAFVRERGETEATVIRTAFNGRPSHTYIYAFLRELIAEGLIDSREEHRRERVSYNGFESERTYKTTVFYAIERPADVVGKPTRKPDR